MKKDKVNEAIFTPKPWRLSDEKHGFIVGANGVVIAELFSTGKTEGSARMNGESIINAVNSYEDFERYIMWVEAKLEIDEMPMPFKDWQEMEKVFAQTERK